MFHIFASGISNQTVLSNFNGWNYSWPLQFTSKAPTSRLFKQAYDQQGTKYVDKIYQWFATLNITMNYHHLGVKPEDYEKYPSVAQFYDALSTNVDATGK